jgi:carbonic anhydrase
MCSVSSSAKVSWCVTSAAGSPRHHTDCGIIRPAGYPEQLAAFFEIPADELESKAVADPYAAVRADTAIARHTLPPSRLVSGVVYDVATGLIEIVDPATGE